MRRVWALAAVSGGLLLPDLAAGYGGGLDGYGCHRNKKGGSGASASDHAPATPLYTTPAAPSQPSDSLDAITDKLRVKSAQRMLKALGFYTGPVDGTMGAKTRTAITAFQKVSGLPADGEVTDRLLDHLTQEVASAQ